MNVFAPDMLNTLLEMHKLHLIEPDQVSQFASVQIGPDFTRRRLSLRNWREIPAILSGAKSSPEASLGLG
jgi:hypothetical protein